jgi:hypothetical protein
MTEAFEEYKSIYHARRELDILKKTKLANQLQDPRDVQVDTTLMVIY